MTPFELFLYLLAVAGGLIPIGAVGLVIFWILGGTKGERR